MKKRYLLMLALATALASCSKSELEVPEVVTPPDVPEVPVPITLSAGVDASAAPQSRALTGDAFPANTQNVFNVVAFSGTAAPTVWTSPYFSTTVNSGASSALTLSTARYYPADGTQKLYFYAYAPTSLTLAADKATYTITGQEDIMAAQAASGIGKGTSQATQTQPEFQFTHKLMQLKFVVMKDDSYQATNPTVTKIMVKDIKKAASLVIGTGVLSFTDAATGTVEVNPTTGNSIVASPGTTLSQVLMIEPVSTVKLAVTAGGVTYPDLTITLGGNNAGKAGTSHTITLTFKQNSIVPTAAITPWGATGTGAGDMI